METEPAAAAAAASAPVTSCRPPTCPPWLQAAIADIEQRVRALAVDEGAATEHSFAERAENYYEKRPQLHALLADLHHRYLYLADRYSQSILAKPHHHGAASDCSSDVDDRSSDADSSLSFQQPPPPAIVTVTNDGVAPADADLLVAELVLAWVGRDVLAGEAERRRAESARRIELQGSLVEVLESERLVLLGENARLGLRAQAAEEDHRVCVLGRRIEALRAKVYALELRNREWYEAMAAWEAERKAAAAEVERLRAENRRLAAEAMPRRKTTRKGGSKSGGGWWWSRVRLAAEWTPCAPSVRKVGAQPQMKGKDGNYYYGGGGCFCL